jgi:glyoxylase-like metal-dependent hydrolase (beta-lactamase superfamily II)
MRVWILRGGVMLLGGMLLVGLLWAFSGSGHDPNHDINMEKAREAADRVHPPPPPGTKLIPGHGG